MKIVFNFNSLRIGLLVASLVVLGGSAEADSTYYTKPTLLKSFFPNSEKVSFQKFQPSKAQRMALTKRLGYKLEKPHYYFFVATTAGKVDGYAFIDDVMGLHRPITFAVKLSPNGVVLREEVMVYRESRGDEVRDPRFAKQFVGKTIKDSLKPNKDIDCVSGATISSRAITVGVRRALVLFDTAIAQAPLRVSASSP